MLTVVVARFSSDDDAIRYSSGFVDDEMFVHNGLYGAWLIGRLLQMTHQGAEPAAK